MPLPDDVREAMTAGKKIDAIRLLREQTGLGLAEAKAAVETGAVPDDSHAPPDFTGLPSDVAAALASGNKIKAIKLLREASGLGLVDAKEIIDRASREAKRHAKLEVGGLSPVAAPRSGVSPASVMLIVVIIVAIVWLYTKAK